MNPSNGQPAGSVVLGFDAGWRMKHLLNVAADEAARREAALAIVTVSRPVLDPDLSASGQQAAERRAEALARKRLTEAAEFVQASHQQLTVTTHYLSEEQAHAARQPLSSTQLLVVGTVGQHGRRAFELESVSRILLKATCCPVLVVPDQDTVGSMARERGLVVAGVGEHPSDSAVIPAAWAESVRRRCGLELVHAYRDRPQETSDQGIRRAADVAARAIAEAGVPLGEAASVLLSRDLPAVALIRRAGNAVLLVIGSRPGSLSGLVLGSVGREILNSLPCPILVIPYPRPEARARVSADANTIDLDASATTTASPVA
jgi:nucleotide-binding universal stress UspA family protein